MKTHLVTLEKGTSGERVGISIPEDATFEELVPAWQDGHGIIVLARVGNVLHELSERIAEEVSQITLLDTTDSDGYRVYMRTLSFVFLEAVKRVLPATQTKVEHSISGGLYCVIEQQGKPITLDTQTRDAIAQEMQQLISADIPILRQEIGAEEARSLFAIDHPDKAELFRYPTGRHVAVYRMGDAVDSFYGYMAPSTRYVSIFALELFDHGIVLLGVDRESKERVNNFIPTYLLSDTYNEAEDWSERQGIYTVAQLNQSISHHTIGDVCRMNEALQDYKLMTIAGSIARMNKRIILIAAPSSSGKTSFAHKLMTSLRVIGFRPLALSLDDYFVNREDTPLDADGKPDFESLQAVDLPLFNHQLNELLQGKVVPRYRYNFLSGRREETGVKMRVKGANPIIIEGIHGLNPALTALIDDRWKYRIALSVITQVNLDNHNRIPTTDLRLMRRMARDKQFRGKDVRETIRTWPGVRLGEDRNIFPYSELADVMFNSSFVYEIAAIKPLIYEDLCAIAPDEPEYVEAARLVALLNYFLPMEDTSDIVNTSILREFIGGSKILPDEPMR